MMLLPSLAILGPLGAAVVILLLRRGGAWLALLGALVGVVGAAEGLALVAAGARPTAAIVGLPDLPLRLRVDALAGVESAAVAVVALLVLVYAVGYLAEEPDRPRFFAEMSFFVAAMQALVLAGDWVLFLAAWELIGLASYLLIGFWFERPGVKEAATRAFLTTRGADLGLYLAVFLLIAAAGTSEIGPTLAVGGTVATAASLLLLLAAMGKAAQVPFQGWLQDAMLGPTPVSALLHSATLVAAGAILLIRTMPLLPPSVQLLIGLVGGLTILVTGVMALAQRDLKRLLASSTSSQLGFMLLAIGAGSAVAALAHLVFHAAMKGALFLGAGIFQHARDSTSFERLGGVGRAYPAAFALFAVAALALAGVPPLAGFWSKDAILASTLEGSASPILALLGYVGAAMTGAYVARALRLLWLGDGGREEVPGLGWMLVGLGGLALLAAALGIAAEPIAGLVGAELPEQTLGMALGLAVVVVGLLVGWLVPSARLLGSIRPLAARGFRPADGWLTVVVYPALSLAASVDRTESALHAGVLGVGRAGLGAARLVGDFSEVALHAGVLGVGRAGLGAGRLVRGFGEDGLDGFVTSIARWARSAAGDVRRLQSGLVFRELTLAAVGTAAVVVVLLLAG